MRVSPILLFVYCVLGKQQQDILHPGFPENVYRGIYVANLE